MSYAVIEASVADANIVEIYQFTMGSTVWRQTSSVDPITYGGYEYTPNPIERPAIELAGEISRQTIQLNIASTNELAALFISGSPENMISIRIYQGHRNDGEFVLIFSGRVLQCRWTKDYKASLFCEPIYTSLKRSALKQNYSERCNYVVYSGPCGAARNSVPGIVTAISGLSISVDSGSTITNGRLIGGIISVGSTVRTITSHSGDDLTITQPFINAAVGDQCSLYIGCDKTLTACNDWHANLDNFGAEPYIAGQNPFVGRIL